MPPNSIEEKVGSPKLRQIAREGLAKSIKKGLEYFNSSLDKAKALEVSEFVVRPGAYKDIDEIDQEVKSVEAELNNELKAICRQFGLKDLKFVHQLSERFQVEIPVRFTNDLDDRFIPMSQKKQVKRYRTTEINRLIIQLENVENE
jgi:DNA mismatch repair ATPase MutS